MRPAWLTGDDTAIDMAGGRVRIAFPADWSVSKNFVQVQDGDTTIYQTDDMGKLLATFDTDDEKAAAARVSHGDSNITIDLGTEWGRRTGADEVGRSLVILFSEVTASKVAGAATFTSSSSARGGNLRRLPTTGTPSVTVGNILGRNVAEAVTTPVPPDTTPQ